MYLYLSNAPRTLYLITDQQDEKQGKPRRALVFRAAEGSNSQAIVEFLRAEEVDMLNLVRLSSRIVKGCLGLISVDGGTLHGRLVVSTCLKAHARRDIPGGGHQRD